jgi:hypothetical protein
MLQRRANELARQWAALTVRGPVAGLMRLIMALLPGNSTLRRAL